MYTAEQTDLRACTHTIRHMPLLKVMIHNIWRSGASVTPPPRFPENTEDSIRAAFEELISRESSKNFGFLAEADRLALRDSLPKIEISLYCNAVPMETPVTFPNPHYLPEV